MASKVEQLEAIAQRIRAREVDIEIARTCITPVPGEGDPEADIMFVGEAPGAQEDKQGRPFVGASGKFLEEMLGTIGLTRDQVFITNIVKFRPPDNRDPSKEEIAACLPYLLEQIQVIAPALVVFLGRHAMNVFFPELKISEAHGCALRRTVHVGGFELKDQVFLPLYHPAAALYNGGMRATLQEDFANIPAIITVTKQTSL
jgi:uracil-DNA glycosylase family 4